MLMNENIAVYEALRAHILQKESQIANETIYMYVTYFALLAIGSIWSSWFSLVPFFSLIVFQSMINGDQWAITKASAYIKIFFEEPRDDIHWEQLHHDIFLLSVVNGTINRTIGWYIYKCGATILSVLSFLSILLPILHDVDYQFNLISAYLAVRIVAALILCMITVYMNKQYFPLRDERDTNQSLVTAIRTFYKEVLQNNSTNLSCK